jgi:hypothetical protein
MARQRLRRQPRFALLLVLLVVTLALLLVLGARPAGAPVWRQHQRRNASSSSAGPGRRYGHVAWPDGMGTGGGWLLGGWGIDSVGNEGRLNDLWRTSDGASWELVGGSTLVANDGLYDLSHESVVTEIIREACRVSITVRVHVLWWGDEITWRLSGDDHEHGPFPDMSDTYIERIVGLGEHSLIALDSYGDGWQGGWWEVTLTQTGEVLAGGPRDGLVSDGFRVETPFEISLASCTNVDLSPRPGARAGAAVATMEGSADVLSCAYLFGGTGHTRHVWGSLNDLWRHTERDGWRWVSGSSLPGERGIYGILGRGSLSNVPGSRRDHALWTSSSNVWLFGGTGSASVTASALGGIGYLNDLWMFNATAGDWTWMGGSTQAQHVGTPTSPSGRSGHVVWTVDGQWYLWGGFGVAAPEQFGPLNDLWVLDGSAVDQRQDVCPDLPGWLDIEAYDCAGYRDNGWCGALDAADFGVNGIDANEACCSTCDGFQPAAVCASCIRPWRARKWDRLLELTLDGSGVYSGPLRQPGGRENFVFWADSRDARAAWLFGGARALLTCFHRRVAVARS